MTLNWDLLKVPFSWFSSNQEKHQFIQLKLSQLIVNQNNPRDLGMKERENINFINESEVINYFCVRNENDTLNLIKSILEKDMPLDRLIVIKAKQDTNSYVSLDGNRRLTVFKILNDPQFSSKSKSKN